MVNRLIVDAPACGAWNMAVDEALFRSVANDSTTVFRLYQWSEPTLSLGYFQHASDRDLHVASRNLSLVRRSTGGGAIVHDHELTYSLVTQLPDNRLAGPRAMMAQVHESLVALFDELRIPARLCSGTQNADPEAFLCFARHTAGDILVGPHKVAGSAQRRHRMTLLQHGSILLNRSAAAPELPGVNDLISSACSVEAIIQAWPQRLERVFSDGWMASEILPAERELAGKIERHQFANPSWNLKR